MSKVPLQPTKPLWVERMKPGCWYQISGDHPDLELSPTPAGTRYLMDTDPAGDVKINPAKGAKERLRRWLGRRPHAPWGGRCGFPSITEGWNGAVFASRLGASGSMIVFGGGHNDYFGSDVHAFDLSTRQWSRISDGYVAGGADAYGAGAVYPDSVYPDGSPLPPHTYGYVQYDPVGNDYLLLKGQLELGPDVKATPISHMFNLDSLTWRRGPKHPLAILELRRLDDLGCVASDSLGPLRREWQRVYRFHSRWRQRRWHFWLLDDALSKESSVGRSQYDGDRSSARYYRRDCQRRKCALCARPECAGGRTRAAFMFGGSAGSCRVCRAGIRAESASIRLFLREKWAAALFDHRTGRLFVATAD